MQTDSNIDASLERPAPQDLTAERAVLGGILVDNESIGRVLGVLQPEDFYRESHRKIFRAMIDLYEEKKPLDLVILSDLLNARGNLEAVGGSAYIVSLLESTPTAANIQYHGELVKRGAYQRKQIEVLREGMERAYSSIDDPAVAAAETASRLLSLQNGHAKGFVHIAQLIPPNLKRIEQAVDSKTPIIGLPTGLTEFEARCGSIKRGHLVIVGGRTSTGKTSLGLCMARSSAVKGCPVAFVSAESPLDELTVRLLSQVTKIENVKLQRGILQDREIARLADGAGRLGELPMYLLGGVRTWELIKAYVRGLKARQRTLGMVVVDYAQLLSVNVAEKKRYLEVSKISSDSKALALELDLAVILLSQLSRDPEKQGNRRPMLSDLRESGSLEQDGDIVLLLYQDKKAQKDFVELICAKFRDGRVDTIPMRFNTEIVSFTDWVEPTPGRDFTQGRNEAGIYV